MSANNFLVYSKQDNDFNDAINFVIEIMQQHTPAIALNLFIEKLKNSAQHVVCDDDCIEIFDGTGTRVFSFNFEDED